MKVIFNRALLFRGPKGEKFKVAPSPNPQDAPNWVRSTSAFQLCAKSGVAIEVIQEAPRPKPAASQKDESLSFDGDSEKNKVEKKDESKGNGEDSDSKAKAAKK